MSEINKDEKYTLIELTTDSGLNFSSDNPRIKHTGTGTFTIQSTQGKLNLSSGSTADDSLNLDSAGGIDIDASQEISIETSDTTYGIKIAETTDVPIDIGAGGGTFLMGKLGETAQMRGSLTIAGDLTVNGDTVSTNVIVNETEDPMLRLNAGAIGSNAVDIGFVGDRGDDDNIGFFWDESANEFVCTFLTNDAQLELTGTPQNTGISDYADFHAGTGEFDDTLYAAGQKFSINGTTATMILNTTGTVAITTNETRALTIESDGTVGINTTDPNNTYALDVNGITNSTQVYQANYLLVPTGSIIQFGGSSAPSGWLLCNGQSVSRITYAALFAVIGTTYGSVDGSTFNLPNTAGRLPVGYNSGDTSYDTLGETGGSKTTTLSTNELPAHTHSGTTNSDGSHTHTINDPGHNHVYYMASDDGNSSHNPGQLPAGDANPGEPNQYGVNTSTSSTGITINSGGAHTHSFTTGSTGNGNSFSLLNPYIVFNYIIKF
jgi:microcystin-dependent protein